MFKAQRSKAIEREADRLIDEIYRKIYPNLTRVAVCDLVRDSVSGLFLPRRTATKPDSRGITWPGEIFQSVHDKQRNMGREALSAIAVMEEVDYGDYGRDAGSPIVIAGHAENVSIEGLEKYSLKLFGQSSLGESRVIKLAELRGVPSE